MRKTNQEENIGMKIYKTKLTYEVDFVSVKKPDLYNPHQVAQKFREYLSTYNFSVGEYKLIVDTKQEEV
jgi:hypothetical protein